jgi:hypothetical protein
MANRIHERLVAALGKVDQRTRKDAQDQHGVRCERGRNDAADGGGYLGGLDHGKRHGGWLPREKADFGAETRGQKEEGQEMRGRLQTVPKCNPDTNDSK